MAGTSEIHAGLATLFPGFGSDIIEAVLQSTLFANPNCSAKELEERAQAQLFEMDPASGSRHIAQSSDKRLSVPQRRSSSFAVGRNLLRSQSRMAVRNPISHKQRVADITEQRLRNPLAFSQAARSSGAGNPRGRGTMKPRTTTARGFGSRLFTLDDVDRKRVADEIANMPSYAEQYRRTHLSSPAQDITSLDARESNVKYLALQAMDFTNKYRASKALAPCRWHDGIASIAARHAAQMASGAAGFNHDGFDERHKAFPVKTGGASENIAMIPRGSNVAEVCVNGWIKSPGHEKNMSGSYDLCGIGVALSPKGYFYFTQLFAKAA